jgi:putative transposase
MDRRNSMGRVKRQLVDDGCYHVIARGNNGLPVFMIKDGFYKFRELLMEIKEMYGFKIYHYCFMSNHFHLLVQLPRSADMPIFMRGLLLNYSSWYRGKTGYVGHLWKGRYKSYLIQKESYLLECGRYIERNPVKAKIVSSAGDYLWSSYNYYAIGKNDSLVDEDFHYSTIGTDVSDRRKRYREFVKIESPYIRSIEKEVEAAYL